MGGFGATGAGSGSSSGGGGSSDNLSPELVPIVTLFSAQAKRRYCEGPFMLLKDLDSNGNPCEREWNEVFAILIGNQLTYWDSSDLNPGSKPNYINLGDSNFKICKTLQSSNSTIDNVIVLSTTLKNRFLLQFSEDANFKTWYSSLRLAAFEYKALQEAYTASLLSSRGSLLSNIKTILAEKRFTYEDWVSVRFGTGMPWKRCYAVIEPSKVKKKSIDKGRILFYENEKKHKKSLMAIISTANFVYAVYPKNHNLIDQSTMIKLDCKIQFEKNDDAKECSVFIMPEQHSAVPGYDTLIRFIVPVMDSFALYGRPMKLKAYKSDPESLLFALPVLPNLYYLDLKDILNAQGTNINWTQFEWDDFIKNILQIKLSKGFTGIGAPVGSKLADLKRNLIDGKIDPMEYLISSPTLANNGKFPNLSKDLQNPSLDNLTFHAEQAPQAKAPVLAHEQPVAEAATQTLQLPAEKQKTPQRVNRRKDPSVSPQILNIYTKYSQLPENDLSDNMQRMNLQGTSTYNDNNNDDLYPANFSDEDEDDDDDDNADVFIAKPSGNQKQRVLSPFTAFNTTFKESMKQNIDYQVNETSPSPLNSNSSLNLPKQRARDNSSPLRNTVNSDNLYPTAENDDDDDERNPSDAEDENVFSAKPAPSSAEEEFNFSPSMKQSGTFTPPPQHQKLNRPHSPKQEKISTSMFDEPVFNPYLKTGSPRTPIDQQVPPIGPGPVRVQNRQHSPNQFNTPPSYPRGYNKGSPKLPQGYQQRPPQQYYQGPPMNNQNSIPPHHYRQNQPQQQFGPTSPVNQFMPQFPKQGLAPQAGGYQQPPQQQPYQMYGAPMQPPQQMGYRGAPLPPPQGYTRQGPQMQYGGYQQPQQHMHRKPPPGPNGGQAVKSFKHDPYAIAKSS